jgi:type II secretion system protein H
MSASGRRGGFTLVELALVLALAALVVATVLPSVSGTLESARLRQGAAELRATLNRARALAAARSRTLSVVFGPGSGEYRIAGLAAPELRALPEGVRIDAVRIGGKAPDGEEARISFFPDGGAEEAEIVLSSGGSGVRRVVVDPLTGGAEAAE